MQLKETETDEPQLVTLPKIDPVNQDAGTLADELLSDSLPPTEPLENQKNETELEPIKKRGRPKKNQPSEEKKPHVALSEIKPKQDPSSVSKQTSNDEQRLTSATALAKVLTLSIVGIFTTALGDDMKASDEEKLSMEQAWTSYLLTRKEVEPPAWALVAISTACYAAPKMQRPTAKERLLSIASKLKSFLSRSD